MTSYQFSRWRISAILYFRGPMMGSLKSPCTTSCSSSIEIIALNCLVFEKIAFLHFGSRRINRLTHTQLYSPFEKAAQLYAKNATENLTNQQHETLKRYLAQSTDKQMDRPIALSRSRCRGRRLSNCNFAGT